MKVQAEISLYPLRQNDLTKPIRQFVQVLEEDKLKVKTGAMSSFVTGDSEVLFRNLREAFEQIAREYEVVMSVKLSNACPDTEKEIESI
jgi:uncharacterized protein YqgV (UPF0045/DUF77 family)